MSQILKDQVAGWILAGGQGQRMGGADKGCLQFDGRALIEYEIACLNRGVSWLGLSVNRSFLSYSRFGLPCIQDKPDYAGQGPLSGIASLGDHLPESIEYVCIVPCDTPFLPENTVARLMEPFQKNDTVQISYAMTEERIHPSVMMVKKSILPSSEDFLKKGEKRLKKWVLSFNARPVFFESYMLMNLNSLSDLEEVA